MVDKKRQRTQKTKPQGIDPETGKPYEPIRIPVPERGEVDSLLERAMKPRDAAAGKRRVSPEARGKASRRVP
jgi:hypothetical protein